MYIVKYPGPRRLGSFAITTVRISNITLMVVRMNCVNSFLARDCKISYPLYLYLIHSIFPHVTVGG